jgi:hypothetical protein
LGVYFLGRGTEKVRKIRPSACGGIFSSMLLCISAKEFAEEYVAQNFEISLSILGEISPIFS